MKYKRWDLFIKGISLVTTAVAISIGVWKFIDEQDNERKDQLIKSKIEYKRAIWKEQRALYAEISVLAAEISIEASTDSSSAQLKTLANSLSVLYWGRSILLVDKDVAQKLKAFYDEVWDFTEGRGDSEKLKYRAHQLSETCSGSSETLWKDIEALYERD